MPILVLKWFMDYSVITQLIPIWQIDIVNKIWINHLYSYQSASFANYLLKYQLIFPFNLFTKIEE